MCAKNARLFPLSKPAAWGKSDSVSKYFNAKRSYVRWYSGKIKMMVALLLGATAVPQADRGAPSCRLDTRNVPDTFLQNEGLHT
jgi:hypothetical protein